MTLEELDIILAKGEDIRTEYKQAMTKVPGSFYDTVASFLNREGGIMFLFQMGSSLVEKGSKLNNIRMNEIKDIHVNDFQKGASLAEKGRKLLSKRNITLLSVIAMCVNPVKINDLLTVLKFHSRDRFRELYLTPLRHCALIEQTIKDKPNSPDQKYMLTEKGKMFIGGFEVS